MKFFKKSFILSAALSLQSVYATNLPSFEIVEVKAPAVVNLLDKYKKDLEYAVRHEMGEIIDYHNSFGCEVAYHVARNPNSPYKFSGVFLDEAETTFRTYLKSFMEKFDFSQVSYKVDPMDFEKIISRVLSVEHFNDAQAALNYKKFDHLDFSKITVEEFAKYMRVSEKGTFLYHLSDPNTSDEQIQSYKNSMYDPTISFVSPSKFRGFMKEAMEKSERFRSFVSGFGVPENPEERPDWYVKHELGIFTQDLLKSVFNTAKRIYASTNPGDNLVIFGNTPYYLGRALKLLMESKADKRNIIDFPFSTIRTHPTPSRLDYFKSTMDKKGFFSEEFYENKHTYFIDVYYSASGLSYVLDVLVDHLEKGSKNPHEMLKNISAIAMNDFNNKSRPDSRQSKILGTQKLLDGDVGILTLPSIAMPRQKIACQVFFTEGHDTMAVGAVDYFPHLLRGYPKYNADFWHPSFEYLLTHEGTPNHKMILEHFDANINNFISQGL